MPPRPVIDVQIPPPFRWAGTEPYRYKVWYGGRGGSKSWGVARLLLIKAYRQRLRILCTREYQNSIADSVHRLLVDQISLVGLERYFSVNNNSIKSSYGSEFLFKGIHRNINEIKSLEGVDICWVEEAQRVPEESWRVLIPTIRKEGSEIWVTFNPDESEHPTYARFVTAPPPNARVVKVNFSDNPWLPDTLREEMEYCRKTDLDAYRHIWEGEPRGHSAAEVFHGKWEIDCFDAPPDTRFYFGADWGFSQDPTVLVRCWIQERKLYIDHEAFGVGVDIDETPALFRSVPGAEKWPIKADSARPETISAMRRARFNIHPAAKWHGSVEDGVAHLRSYEKIIVHERCRHTIDALKFYRYKTDKVTGDVLPILLHDYSHIPDALRYALDGRIKRGGDGPVGLKVAAL